MSDMRDEQSDAEQPVSDENEPTKDGEAFKVAPTGENEDGMPKMRVSELRDAAADPDHPRHEEAKEVGRRMAESMSKSMPKIDVSDRIKRITDSITPLKGMTTVNAKGLYPSLGIKMPDLTRILPEAKTPGYLKRDFRPKPELPLPPVVDQSWYEEAMEGITEANEEKEQRELATLDFMQRVAESIETQNEKLDAAAGAAAAAEVESKDRDRRNARIAGWTLACTIIGIAVAIGIAVLS